MKPKWKWIAILGGTLFASITGFGFDIAGGPTIVREHISHSKPDNLSFSFSRCNGSSHSIDTVDKASWNMGSLTIDVVVTPNCGTTWLLGSYKIVDESELILGYKTISPALIGCNCDFKATYQIHNLDRRDYNITIKEYAFINKAPKTLRMLYDIGPDIVEIEEW